MGRASAYRSLKEYKRAYADLTKVLSLDPKCIEAYRVWERYLIVLAPY